MLTGLYTTAVPQLFDSTYTTVVLPAALPVTLPAESMVAIVGSAMPQKPPVTESARVIVVPTQVDEGPAMGEARHTGITVMPAVVVAVPQILVFVNVMVALPAASPFTIPEVLMVATDGADELHVPLAVSVRVIALPAHTDAAPDMAET